MKNRIPYATRTLKKKILSVAPLLENDRYIDMTENQFIGEVFKNSGGSLNPTDLLSLYNSLMADAGLEPKFSNDG